MKRLIALGAGVFLLICGFWVGLFELFKAVGGNNQATSLYGFTSGPGPMILTALLGSTIFVTVWHSLNCHVEGCLNIGKHKVRGSPYCNLHHEDARHEKTVEQLLTETNDLLRQVLSARVGG